MSGVPVVNRLLAKAVVGAPDECWEFTGTKRNGYGVIGAGGHRGPMLYAHRVMWEWHTALAIPDGLCVLHSCDNRACVNPSHLFLGSKADNSRDMASKGRWRNQNAPKTTCKRGHPFSAENTKHVRGGRECLACRKLHSLKRHNPELKSLMEAS